MHAPRRTQQSASHAADERLVELSQTGSEEAFAVIVERYREPLQRYCARLIGAIAAQDVVQDVFLSAWKALRG